ncbi:MAG: AEC family transporter [Nitrospirota bacterium]
MNFNTSILSALIPIFIVILSGYAFRKLRFPGDEFWSYAERITYFVLFPALLLQKTATAPLDLRAFIPMATALYAAILAMTGLVFLMRPWRTYGTKAFTSFFQGSIRFNTYVGLSAALALFGDEGLTLAAVAIAVLIPFINVLCVTVLVAFNDSKKRNWRAIMSGIIRNPLILSCTAGILLNISGVGLHSTVSDTLSLFGRASLPLGLLALGAGLDIAAARADRKVLAINCTLKLLVLPAIMWTASLVMNIRPLATAVAVLFAALPGSPMSFILAKQLGGDSRLMASILTVQVLVSMFTLPVIMALIT